MKFFSPALFALTLVAPLGALGQGATYDGDALGAVPAQLLQRPATAVTPPALDHTNPYEPQLSRPYPLVLPAAMEGDAPIWIVPAHPANGWIELLPDVWHRGSFIPGYEPQS